MKRIPPALSLAIFTILAALSLPSCSTCDGCNGTGFQIATGSELVPCNTENVNKYGSGRKVTCIRCCGGSSAGSPVYTRKDIEELLLNYPTPLIDRSRPRTR